ncbi:TRAP transporter substrate-binding protein [Roseitranquillus sediminis]|uniref:TRAP transporter substrate-binding protein n=1 Tax=Roseitranquillus sediminis TaxID=2809051 RepID=UPI001D0CAE74|nr:TRAP transporter substrate-binding protein [Roseitranquillus sediminis]MBM9593656.1 TRAP transporter substrate-binding protein [Roseitranquillus sediminis]
MRLIRHAATLAFSTLALGAAAHAQEHTFKLHHFLGAQTPSQTEMLEPWARQVEANSGGRIAIEIYPAMSLGGRPPELIQQARDGVVDIIWTVNGYTPGLFPRTEVMELPTVFTNDPVAANLALHDMFDSDLAEEYQGVEVMFLHTHPGNALYTLDSEVGTPADVAGMNLRIPTRTGAWIIEALGANPVAMPVPELPQSLSKGVVDGAFIPYEIGAALKLQDQIGYVVEGPDDSKFGSTTFQVSMNKARWDSLPPEIQKAFRDASDRDWWGEVGEIWKATDDAGLQTMTGAGVTLIELDPENYAAFETQMQPVVDRWIEEVEAKGIDGATLVEKARALIDENTDTSM